MDAQLPLISVDLSLQTAKNPSDMPEIVAQVTDPAPEEVSLAKTMDELNLMATPTSSSVTTVGATVVPPTLASAHPAEQSADAVAMDAPLSSQKADTMPPPINTNGDKGGSNSAGASHNVPAAVVSQDEPVIAPNRATDNWCDHAKGVKQLSRKGEAFILPSGEACVKIPDSVIEKNQKAWEPFVLGQFYSDPPSQGTLHNIVKGIWSKQYRDIAVSKMEGFSFLFRIPNAATRNRVIKQKLWQIEG